MNGKFVALLMVLLAGCAQPPKAPVVTRKMPPMIPGYESSTMETTPSLAVVPTPPQVVFEVLLTNAPIDLVTPLEAAKWRKRVRFSSTLQGNPKQWTPLATLPASATIARFTNSATGFVWCSQVNTNELWEYDLYNQR